MRILILTLLIYILQNCEIIEAKYLESAKEAQKPRNTTVVKQKSDDVCLTLECKNTGLSSYLKNYS